ncbi:MAG: hypothetical protein PWP61_637 [Trichococcus sp.]|jgi:hypothetical protein|nr:hypothetical protein [Trichococcus sp.]
MQNSVDKLDIFVNGLYLLTDFIYELIKNSFFFWLYLMKGFGIFTLYASIEALLAVSSDVLDKKRKNTFNNFKTNYTNSDKRRFLSVFIFFLVLYLFIIPFLPAPSVVGETLWSAIKYLAIFSEAFVCLMLVTRTVFEREFLDMKWTVPLQIYMLVRVAGWSLVLLFVLVATLWFSLRNGIFLIGFAPGVVGISSVWVVAKIKKRFDKMLLKK